MELQTSFVHSSCLFFLSVHTILFMFIYLSFPQCASAGILGNQTDKLALLDLKSQITEDPQGLMDSWNATLNVCQWPGVTCGHKHQRVISLDLKDHRLAGTISPSIGNLSFLRILDISDNSFHGVIPPDLGQLIRLQTMNLSFNFLSGEIPFTLSRCINVVNLILDHNILQGHIPTELGSLTKLEMLYLKNNNLTGNVPNSVGNLTSLREFYISYNELEGELPETMTNMRSLIELGVSVNSLTGEFPPALYNLSSLTLISLSFNKFRGRLRTDFGLAFPNLQRLYLANNYFTGSIPASLSNCSDLLRLDIPINNFTGNIPLSFGNLKNLLWLNVLDNQLGSGAPDDLNFINSLTNCKMLEFLDIANNKFGGNILRSIYKHVSLQNLNLSFNHLDGEVPVQGVFADARRIQVMGNMNLCGGIEELHLHPCLKHANKRPKKHIALILLLALGTSAACLTLLLLVSYCCVKKGKHRPRTASSFRKGYTQVSYEDLLNATGGFSSNNLIGSGSFGSVYRGNLSPEGTIIAVKVLKLEKKGASKSFLAECEALRNIRHRNLVKISTVCSSVDFDGNDFKALIYPFMENGSLEEWLHPKEGQMLQKRLSILHRLNITIDVASALHYLHSQCHTSIVHCDLKPSNILLDNDLTALVSDFGLAKFLSDAGQNADVNQFSSSGIKGTVGYAAPEYGMGGQVSSQGDVYSFGILLLEIFTGRRPTSELFEDNETLHSFVKQALPRQVMDVVDQSTFYETEPGDLKDIFSCRSDFTDEFAECLVSILTAGVACSEETPQARISMGQLIFDLISIRNKLNRILVHSEKVKISRKGES